MTVRRSVLLEVDSICSRFEQDWTSGKRGELIAEYLAVTPAEAKEILLKELVATECEFLEREGCEPNRDDYLSRFPELSHVIDAGLQEWESEKKTSRLPVQDIPDRIGEYRIVREIGRGGIGIVYEAVHDTLARTVALKTLLNSPARFREKQLRLEREATAVARLQHKNIAAVFDCKQDDGVVYIVMQFVDGKSLRQRITEGIAHRDGSIKPDDSDSLPTEGQSGDSAEDVSGNTARPPSVALTANESAGVIRDAAYALSYSHGQGVLHRDVKPSNLLLGNDNQVSVVDFGLARFNDTDSNLTNTGEVIGTPRYMPPEALDGISDERSDIYGLGLTLFELLTLKPAFGETDRLRLIRQITQQPVSFSADERTRIPNDLQTITLKAAALEPADRYQTARELADDLQRYLSAKPIRARRATAVERFVKWAKRNQLVATLGGLLILLTAVAMPTIAWLRASASEATALAAIEKADKESAQALATAEAARVSAARTARFDSEYASLIRDADLAIKQDRFTYATQLLEREELRLARARKTGNDRNSMLIDEHGQDRRGWEWTYLRRQLDMSILSFQAHKPDPSMVEFVPIAAMVISPDGSRIATAMESAVSPSGEVQFFGELAIRDLSDGRLLHDASPQEFTSDVAFSPDGSQLATISMHNKGLGLQGFVRVRDVESGRVVHTIELQEDSAAQIQPGLQIRPRVRFDQSGEFLLTSSPLMAFRTDNWQEVWKQSGNLGVVLSNQVIRVGESSLTRHNLKTGELIEELDFKFPPPRDITLVGEDQFSILNATGTEFSIWSAEGDKATTTNRVEVAESVTAVMTPDKRGFVRAGNANVELYSAQPTGKQQLARSYRGHRDLVSHIQFTRDGKRAVTADFQGWVRVWDLHGPDPSEPIVFKETSAGGTAVDAIAFDDDTTRIQFACSRYRNSVEKNRGASGWFALPNSNEPTNDTPQTFQSEIKTTRQNVWPRTDFAFSPRGNFFVAPGMEPKKIPLGHSDFYCTSGQINIWSTATSKLIDTIELGTRYIVAICWSLDQRRLAIATAHKPASGERVTFESILDSESRIAVISVSQEGKVTGDIQWHPVNIPLAFADMCFVPRRDTLAISCTNGTHLLELKTGQQTTIQTLTRDKSTIDANSTGTRIAVADFESDTVRLHNLESNEQPIEIYCPSMTSSIQFSPNGRRLAFAGLNGVTYLCDAKSGHLLLKLSSRPIDQSEATIQTAFLVGADRIGAIAFSPDGNQIATNGRNRQITIWSPPFRKTQANSKPGSGI